MNELLLLLGKDLSDEHGRLRDGPTVRGDWSRPREQQGPRPQGSITFLSYSKRNKAKARSTEQRGRGGAEFERLAGTDKVSLVAKGKEIRSYSILFKKRLALFTF